MRLTILHNGMPVCHCEAEGMEYINICFRGYGYSHHITISMPAVTSLRYINGNVSVGRAKAICNNNLKFSPRYTIHHIHA